MKINKINFALVLLVSSLFGFSACESPFNSSESNGGPVAGSRAGSGGKGAAAIRRVGELLTFQEVGVNLDPIPDLKVFPGLDVVTELAQKLALSVENKGILNRALLPLGQRRYFNLDPKDLSPAKKALLLATYQSIIGQEIPSDGTLVLVAITLGNETYLLPDYYQLQDDISRASILFHEALWVINPKLSLKTVIRSEMAVESLLRSPKFQDKILYDSTTADVLSESFDDPLLDLVGAALYDFRNGPIDIILPSNEMRSLIPKNFVGPIFQLKELVGDVALSVARSGFQLDKGMLYDYWYKANKLNPKLSLFPALMAVCEKLGLYRNTDGAQHIFEGGSNVEGFGDEVFDLGSAVRRELAFDWNHATEENWQGIYPYQLPSPWVVKLIGFYGNSGSIGSSFNTRASGFPTWDQAFNIPNKNPACSGDSCSYREIGLLFGSATIPPNPPTPLAGY